METVKKGRPFGFYVCALGFTFERMAFYTTKYLLAIWIATKVSGGGLGLTDTKAAAMSASFVAWTYITPLIGGYIADHWVNPRICVALGLILMAGAYACVWQAHSLGMVWALIILNAVGTGLFKGNMSGIVGLLFDDPTELDMAFSIQYSFVNIGSFIGTTFIAVLATKGVMSFNGVFGICALFLAVDAIWFILVGNMTLGEAGKTPFKKDMREFVAKEKKDTSNAPLTSGDKKRVFAIIMVTLFSAVFWMVWYMAYMPAYYVFGYGDGADFQNKANWYIGSFQVPTSWFDSINALVCIVLGPVLALVWRKLAARPQGDMSMFKKTALGCALVGVSYVVMALAYKLAEGSSTGKCSVLWLALVCMLMSVGEMVFSPLGNSFINKLAPAKVLGLLLGFWPIAVFIAQRVYPSVYAFLKTKPFVSGYGITGLIVIGFGVILWLFSGKLDAMEKEQ
nr:peptide MFS transporter [uncultured Eubacterium sp.]